MKTLAVLTLALTFSSAAVASAQDAHPEPERLTYDFDDDHVGGEYRQPMGEVLTVSRHGRRGTLIRARAHYVPELLHSVASL